MSVKRGAHLTLRVCLPQGVLRSAVSTTFPARIDKSTVVGTYARAPYVMSASAQRVVFIEVAVPSTCIEPARYSRITYVIRTV